MSQFVGKPVCKASHALSQALPIFPSQASTRFIFYHGFPKPAWSAFVFLFKRTVRFAGFLLGPGTFPGSSGQRDCT